MKRAAHHGHQAQADPHWQDLLLFDEYFHGDTGSGLGASHALLDYFDRPTPASSKRATRRKG
jgi:hypothetical protein